MNLHPLFPLLPLSLPSCNSVPVDSVSSSLNWWHVQHNPPYYMTSVVHSVYQCSNMCPIPCRGALLSKGTYLGLLVTLNVREMHIMYALPYHIINVGLAIFPILYKNNDLRQGHPERNVWGGISVQVQYLWEKAKCNCGWCCVIKDISEYLRSTSREWQNFFWWDLRNRDGMEKEDTAGLGIGRLRKVATFPLVRFFFIALPCLPPICFTSKSPSNASVAYKAMLWSMEYIQHWSLQ